MSESIKHVVGLSGGKDSSAMALRLMEIEPRDYEFICTPTGNELPAMLAHWDKLEMMLGKPLLKIAHPGGLEGLMSEMWMIPNFRARWCTRVLKIEPTIKYMATLAKGSVMYVGLRADEEERQGIFGEDLVVDFPMRRWGWKESDVWAYLQKLQVKIPNRSDCAWCYGQRLGEWYALWKKHPNIYMLLVNFTSRLLVTLFAARSETHGPHHLAICENDLRPATFHAGLMLLCAKMGLAAYADCD